VRIEASAEGGGVKASKAQLQVLRKLNEAAVAVDCHLACCSTFSWLSFPLIFAPSQHLLSPNANSIICYSCLSTYLPTKFIYYSLLYM
jgi:hypothetical protein